MSSGNIAIFIPHKGCPNDCVFCNQKRISGTVSEPTPKDVREILENAVKINEGKKPQIAFFGGSFTAIPKDYMISLLSCAKEYARHFDGIRISTRPDCIDEEILTILKEYGVKAIELGTQGFDNDVLRLNRRGHTAEDTYKASKMIRRYNFELGLQIMTGLYGSNSDIDMMTAIKAAEIMPDTVRIYPTLVICDTALERLYNEGKYIPQSVEEAVEAVSKMIPIFENRGIKIIRIGLHSAGLDESVIAGPFHPAFKELCDSKIYLKNAVEKIEAAENFTGQIFVKKGETSKMVGQKRNNIKILEEKYKVKIKVTENEFSEKYQVEVK